MTDWVSIAMAFVGVLIGAVITLCATKQQIIAARKLAWRSEQLNVARDCIARFSALHNEKPEFDPKADKLSQDDERWFERYWDLLALEFEYWAAGLLPTDLFSRWVSAAFQQHDQSNPMEAARHKAGWEHARKHVALFSEGAEEFFSQMIIFVSNQEREGDLTLDQLVQRVLIEVPKHKDKSAFAGIAR